MDKESCPQPDYYEYVQLCKKRYSEMLKPVCTQWKLTRNEMDIILFLANHPTLNRAADISSRRGMSKSHISKSISRLEMKGLLQCVEDPLDHRTMRLVLTESAQIIKEHALNVQKAFFQKLMHGLTETDILFWHQLIDKINFNMRN